MPRKTQIMHMPIEIYERHGKEKLLNVILDFDAAHKNISTQKTGRQIAEEQGLTEPEQAPKIIVENPDLEVKHENKNMERDADGGNNNDLANGRSDSRISDNSPGADGLHGAQDAQGKEMRSAEQPRDENGYTKEQIEFLQSDKFKKMMLHGKQVNFKPLYLDACIVALREGYGLVATHETLIKTMKEMK